MASLASRRNGVVLTVSPDSTEREVLAQALRAAGYAIVEAQSVAEAQQDLNAWDPELVVIDAALVDQEGLAFCQQAHERLRAVVLPVLRADQAGRAGASVAEALECGAEAPLVMPLDAQVLKATLRAALRSHHLEQDREQLLEDAQSWRTRLDAVLHQMPAGVIIAEAATERVLMVNEEARRLLDLSSDDLSLEGLSQQIPCFHPDGRPYTPKEWPLVRALNGEVIRGEEVELVRPDGTHLLVRLNAGPIRGARGEPVAAAASFVDITDSKRTERVLETVLEAAPNWLAYLDTDLRHLFANRAYAEAAGLTQETVREYTFAEMFRDAPDIVETVRRVVESGVPYVYREARAPKPTTLQTRIADYVDAYDIPVKNAQGEVEGLVISVVDVTEKVRQRQQVEAAERALELIQSSTSSALVRLDRDSRFVYVNAAAERLMGLPRDEILGRTGMELFPGTSELSEAAQRVLATGLEAQLVEVPVSIPPGPDGTVRRLDMTFTPILTAEGTVDGLVVSTVDVTEKVEQRERALESERERARLAENLNNEIAHRVKNNLAMISGLLQMQMHLHPNPELADLLRDAITRVRAFAHIHEQMYSARQEDLDLCDSMDRLATTTQEIYGTTTPMTITVEGDHPEYRSRAVTNLAIVANELLTNAVKHGRPVDDETVHIVIGVESKDGVLRLSIWNSGDTLPEGFDLSEHRSMGLRLVWDVVVEQYGGRFELVRADGGVLAQVELAETALART